MRDYLAHLQRRNLSPNSINAYRSILTRWIAWCGSRDEVETATSESVNAWLDSHRLAPRARYTYVSAVHGFYAWCVMTERLPRDPTITVERPKLPKTLPRPISTDDLATAIDLAADARMRLWLCLAAYEGMRCCEIAGVQIDDLLTGRTPPLIIVARGKGAKQRAVPLHPVTLDALRAFRGPRAGYLFLRRDRPGRADPVTAATVSDTINRYLRDMGIPATSHQLRHWFGTETYDVSRDLRLVQELMGHASPQTTAGYVQYAQHEAAEVVSRLSARSGVTSASSSARGGDAVADAGDNADGAPGDPRLSADGHRAVG